MSSPKRRPVVRVAARGLVASLSSAVILTATATTALAGTPNQGPSVSGVISNLTTWLVGLLAGLATLLFTVGGIRYLLAGGDPGEVRAAKETLKYSAIGYAVAALAPVLVTLLTKLVS